MDNFEWLGLELESEIEATIVKAIEKTLDEWDELPDFEQWDDCSNNEPYLAVHQLLCERMEEIAEAIADKYVDTQTLRELFERVMRERGEMLQ